MATASFTTPSSPLTMAALAAFLDAALGELLNRHRGASAPDNPVEGQLWWDTSGDPVAVLKRYTVAAGWISLLTVNKTTGAVTVQSLTLTAAATGFTIAGGTTSKTLTLDTDVTATNLMLKTGSNLAIGSDADGDTYHRAAGVLARLAKGAANTKKFMNAAGTAPEWASGFRVGAFTRDMAADSGDASIAGIGFKPQVVLLISGFSQGFAIGVAESSSVYGSGVIGGSGPGYTSSAGQFMLLTDNYGVTSQVAIPKTMDADGFTLTWTKTGSPTGTALIHFVALR